MSKSSNGIPDAAEFGLLRAWLTQNGVSQQQIAQWIGNNPSGRTRAQIARELIEHLKTLPKASDT